MWAVLLTIRLSIQWVSLMMDYKVIFKEFFFGKNLQRVDPFVWVICDGLNLFSYNVTKINKQNKNTTNLCAYILQYLGA